MMNQVYLSGKAGRDAKTGVTANGKVWANVSMATSEKIKDVWVPTWHNISAWGKTAEALLTVRKGAHLTVVGKISYREYEKDGVKKQATDILAREVSLAIKPGMTTEQSNDLSLESDYTPSSSDDDIPF